MKITQLKHGQQVQIKGTRAYYQDARVFSLRGYYIEEERAIPEDWDAVVKREKQIGGSEYCFTLAGVMMTNDPAYNQAENDKRDASPHLQAGDIVQVEGKLFKITNTGNNNFGLEQIISQPVTFAVL